MTRRQRQAGWCTLGVLAWLGAPLYAQAALKDSARNTQAIAADAKSTHRTPPLERRVSLDLRNATLRDALHEIDRQARLGLAYTPLIVPVDRRVTYQADSVTVADALERLLHGTGVKAVVTTSETVMLVKAADLRSEAPLATDTGGTALVLVHVTDDTSTRPLVGAVVGIKGTQNQEKTTETGYTALRRVPSGFAVVYVRYLGYTPVEKGVVVPDSGYVTITVPMKMGMARLQEVVTTATGPRRRYELANDITILNVDSLVKTQPVSNVTQILEGRVPGLTVQHTSGAPGDPSRLRLRGIGSLLQSNDPIVVVDGIRVYAAQSDSASANIAAGRGDFGEAGAQPFAAPSPLDQINPASIETIEVLKGPSAATLYGPDAANGVIVITTKRGRPGPARWDIGTDYGVSHTPGGWPIGYYRWGTDYGGNTVLCPLADFGCKADSLVLFQALNQRQYSMLKDATTDNTSLNVSGGSEALTYSISGNIGNQSGIVALPPAEVDRFRATHDGANPFSWMMHPQQLSQWSATSRLTARLSDKADATVSASLSHTTQERSDLERDLGLLMTTYVDAKSGTIWQNGNGSVSTSADITPDGYRRITDAANNLTTSAGLNWRPLGWLTTNATAGINLINREDDEYLPSYQLITDTAGVLNTGRETDVVTTVGLGASATLPKLWVFRFRLSGGINLTTTTTGGIITGATGLLPGSNTLVGAQKIGYSTQQATDQTGYGWYVEPDIAVGPFTLSNGLRFDNSSSFGKDSQRPLFPKIGASWLVSEAPFFSPFKKIFDTFRMRGAYGAAGVWPGPLERLRLNQTATPFLDGAFQPATQIYNLGNTQLRPERSTEIEAGVDADLFRDRISIGVSYYRKMRYDAIETVPVAPSVYGTSLYYANIGDIRNTGLEGTLSTQFVRTDLLSWGVALNASRNHNLLTKLGRGIVPYGPDDSRIVPGYPPFSRWAKPILAYNDANHDGIIEPDEVLVGDSLVYMGQSQPNWTGSLATTVALFRGMVTVSANFLYESGVTQLNNTIATGGQIIFSRGANDPHASFRDQAAIAALGVTDYGLYQTVNVTRFNSIAIGYQVPMKIAHWLMRASALSLSLAGTNLALFTNYKGKDPDVNSFATGERLADNGVIPQPRTWQISVHASY